MHQSAFTLSHFSQYYLVAMATSLAKSENKVQILHLHPKCSHTVKRLPKLVQYIERYSTKYASFVATSYLTFTNEPCQLWSYWTEFHEIFTWYTSIICAVNALTEVSISHSISECQRDESGEFAIFTQNRLPWQRPLRYRKKRSRSIIYGQKLSFDVKIAKIGPADLQIICLRVIIKKDKKERNYGR